MSGAPVNVTSYRKGSASGSSETRDLVPEGPLAIEVIGGQTYTILRSRGQDRELAFGFLLAEGLVETKADVALMRECPDDDSRLLVTLADGREARPGRTLVAASSCGLCGHADIEGLVSSLKPATGMIQVPLETLYELPEKIRAGQDLFRSTGGSHAAAIFSSSGEPLALFEDIGRHNAYDKAIGYALERDLELEEYGAFLSGRVSLEMMVKTARARIPFVAAVSAPSEAAVELAKKLGITLCGFVRGDEVTVYANPERVVRYRGRA